MDIWTKVVVVVVAVVSLPFQHEAESRITAGTQEGGRSHKVIRNETYQLVLDTVFPREAPAANYSVVLRFRPSFHPESQIVIKRGSNETEVIEYTSLSGNIYSKLDEIIRDGTNEDATEMAKLIKVRRRLIQIPSSKVRQWYTDFLGSFGESLKRLRRESERFDKSGTINVAADGTFYDLWYTQGVSEMAFSFYDLEVNEHPVGMLRIVQWMNKVRGEVAILK
ncbi:MAG TPA: hypothetical protein VJH03_13105 [Blastocatellia bacterium]|nr:hypothetical protein [Blastocatellia bacterium]